MAKDMCVPEITIITLSSSSFMCIILFIDHVIHILMYNFVSACSIEQYMSAVCSISSPLFLLEKVTAVEAEPAHVPGLQFPNWDSLRSLLCCSLVSDIIRNHLQQCGASFNRFPLFGQPHFKLCLMIKLEAQIFDQLYALYTRCFTWHTVSLVTRTSC